ncbi:WD40 repeat domain-containing protein [Paenibacillus sp. P96]|uniref:WD40 repeat domain-containing protein n=1 Tax=Paenibacillus zeirhizosphaerae TaxID=2987519 RepID=A0ABT9FMA2_9BACL|nr:WD40 repeat domain-containing protein [Paenibacillus sp. P96]MDP4095799.1 WD40 repeat domain-containing protein [Paenibacillus sp. P96]
MKRNAGIYCIKLLPAVVLSLAVTACQSSGDRLTVVDSDASRTGQQQNQSPEPAPGGERDLTVVKTPAQQADQRLAVARTHRIAASSIQSWLSEDEVSIETTKLVKAGTATEEPKYEYTSSILNVSTGQSRESTGEGGQQVDGHMLVKETISPDGGYSFIQKWKDKYIADNFVKNLHTGEMLQIKGDNYLERGGWLNADTYILAAGSMSGRGEIRQISAADGKVTTVTLEDAEAEMFGQFGVSHGRIYYTDNHKVLKVFEPGQSKPVSLIQDVWSFEISPDSQYIAVSTVAQSGDSKGSKLLIYDTAGSLQGSLIGKGDLISYISWSPDSAKLAFDVYTEDKSGMNGVYIFDTRSGRVIPLAQYYASSDPMPHPVYPFSWSPSGNRLGITLDDPKSLLVTQVIDFK